MFDKLDAYNLVANLVPGAALVYALNFSKFPTPSPDDLGAFLLVSFVAGVMTNRLGSLVLDPLLRNLKFLHKKDYKAFVLSQRVDPKLDTIVANTGLYRTFVAAALIFIFLLISDGLIDYFMLSGEVVFIMFVVMGLLVSLFALRKEDNYIHERISAKDEEAS